MHIEHKRTDNGYEVTFQMPCGTCLNNLYKSTGRLDDGAVPQIIFKVTYDFAVDDNTHSLVPRIKRGNQIEACSVCGTQFDFFVEFGTVVPLPMSPLPKTLLADLRREYGLSKDELQCPKCGHALRRSESIEGQGVIECTSCTWWAVPPQVKRCLW